jgi:hypothetical protein
VTGSVEIPREAIEKAGAAYYSAAGLALDGATRLEQVGVLGAMRAALVAARPYLMPTREELKDVVGQAWDDGNAMGLDGYVGPNRGAGDVDHEAERGRERMVSRVLALLNGDAS